MGARLESQTGKMACGLKQAHRSHQPASSRPPSIVPHVAAKQSLPLTSVSAKKEGETTTQAKRTPELYIWRLLPYRIFQNKQIQLNVKRISQFTGKGKAKQGERKQLSFFSHQVWVANYVKFRDVSV